MKCSKWRTNTTDKPAHRLCLLLISQLYNNEIPLENIHKKIFYVLNNSNEHHNMSLY